MWRHIASNALTLIIVGLVVLAGVLAWAQAEFRASGPMQQAICLKVPRGSTMRTVSEDLRASGSISSAVIFRLGADYSGQSGQLKAGSYLVPVGASMRAIVDDITGSGASTCGTEIVYRIGVSSAETQVRELDPANNRFEQVAAFSAGEAAVPERYAAARQEPDTRYRITIAEGATVWQVATALAAADFLEIDTDSRPEEGQIAPDSYEIVPGTALSVLFAEMNERQNDRLAAAWQNRRDGLPINTPQEALILASIIEKETGLAEERRQVASVFTNRLEAGIRLQSDPTVIYGVTDGKDPLERGIRQSELRRETPYNTYVIDGLPPTPIANPGLASIEAALDPADTEFLFFVADGTGGHAFAATLAEHNANVAKWREIEANRVNE